jgi:hypothetical protein
MRSFRMGLAPLILALITAVNVRAQQTVVQQPDCVIAFTFTATGQTSPTAPNNGLDNRTAGCSTWQVWYVNSGFGAVSITLQSAPNNAGAPGTYATGLQVQQTIISGTNPLTSTNGGFLWVTGNAAWVRILGTLTGAGVVNGAAYGWRIPNASSNGTAGPATNVTIVGPLGQAAMAASIPIVVANNQSNVPITVASPLGQTAMAASIPVTLPNNTTSGCTKTFVNLAASGNVVLVAGVAAQNIYICDLEFSTGTPEDFKLTEGTGAACGGGTADATALMKNISAWSLTPGGGVLGVRVTATTADSLCANQAGTQAAAITLWYLQQ